MQDLARKFTRDEIVPNASKFDTNGEFPWDIVKKAHSAGLMNLHVPQDCGGLGMGVFDGCLVTEELAYGCTGITLAIEGTGLGVCKPHLIFFQQLKQLLFLYSKHQSTLLDQLNKKRNT